MKKPKILITNDDSINAPGIRKLISIMRQIGDVIVMAPDSPAIRNGTCHHGSNAFKN